MNYEEQKKIINLEAKEDMRRLSAIAFIGFLMIALSIIILIVAIIINAIF